MSGFRLRVIVPVSPVSVAFILVLTLAIAGCAATAATTTPTTSPQTGNACAAAPGFVGAKPVTAGGRFPDVSFPAGSLGYTSADPEANGFQFQVIHVCLAGSAPDAV